MRGLRGHTHTGHWPQPILLGDRACVTRVWGWGGGGGALAYSWPGPLACRVASLAALHARPAGRGAPTGAASLMARRPAAPRPRACLALPLSWSWCLLQVQHVQEWKALRRRIEDRCKSIIGGVLSMQAWLEELLAQGTGCRPAPAPAPRYLTRGQACVLYCTSVRGQACYGRPPRSKASSHRQPRAQARARGRRRGDLGDRADLRGLGAWRELRAAPRHGRDGRGPSSSPARTVEEFPRARAAL